MAKLSSVRSPASGLVAALFVALPVAALTLACGSSKSDGSEGTTTTTSVTAPTPTAVDLSVPLSGDNIALGLLGDPTLTGQSTFDTTDANTHELDVDIVAQINEDAPGQLDAYAADLHSQDAMKVATALAGMNTLLSNATSSAKLQARIAADPVFAGVSPEDYASLNILGGLVGAGADAGGLVSDGGMLVCNASSAPHLGKVNGVYGDGWTGLTGAAHDLLDLPGIDAVSTAVRAHTLSSINSGGTSPDPESRLGAYAATKGYPSGTVGAAVHGAIGTIYMALGNYGQEKIGRVFNDPQAKALYNQPVSSCASLQMATTEHNYWADCKAEDSYSAGGQLGSAFNPWSRDLLQKYVFSHL